VVLTRHVVAFPREVIGTMRHASRLSVAERAAVLVPAVAACAGGGGAAGGGGGGGGAAIAAGRSVEEGAVRRAARVSGVLAGFGVVGGSLSAATGGAGVGTTGAVATSRALVPSAVLATVDAGAGEDGRVCHHMSPAIPPVSTIPAAIANQRDGALGAAGAAGGTAAGAAASAYSARASAAATA
jgi:hypothetical protein